MNKNCVILKWNPAISSYSMAEFLKTYHGVRAKVTGAFLNTKKSKPVTNSLC